MYAFGRPSAPLTVDEEIGSSHDLGIAFSVNGGRYGADGSAAMETHVSAGGGHTFTYPHSIHNRVNYRYYNQYCNSGWHGRWMRAASWYDLVTDPVSIAESTYQHCVTKHRGDYAYKTHGSNYTMSGAISLPGISVNAHASFTTSTQLRWNFSGDVWLCANQAVGWPEAQMAAARLILKSPSCHPGLPCAEPVDKRK